MQLSQNENIFSEIFSTFIESIENLEYFEEKDQRQSWFLSEIKDCKKRGYLNAQNAPWQNNYRESTC